MSRRSRWEYFRIRNTTRYTGTLLRQYDGAGRDLQHYLQHAPNAQDREEIENHVKELKRYRVMMN